MTRAAARPGRALRLASALMALGLAGCGGDDASAADPAPELLAVESAPVRVSEGYTVRERFAGRVTAHRTSELGFERGARVVEVAVDEGDVVEADRVLARLETRELEARRRELEARVSQVQAQLALARRTSARRETLARQETISEQAWDEARFQEEALAAELAAARAALEAVRASLELSLLRAPFAGTITARLVDEGPPVAPGQPVLRLIENARLELRVGLPPDTAAALVPGERYPARSDAGAFTVRLETRIPSVDPGTRTVAAVFAIPEPPTGLHHGSMASLSVETKRPGEGFWLPLTALAESRRGLWAAFALVPDAAADAAHRVERREVQLVHAEAERAFVRGTLRDGDRIVVDGLHRIVPGQRVRVLR
ncbi:MAG: efflux RND transporter periplasmic adaptor subunit [Myxococcota bacterium]|nr:efflux RND transporter periplasmic adaptor subunit [Myxococcota bacterium]